MPQGSHSRGRDGRTSDTTGEKGQEKVGCTAEGSRAGERAAIRIIEMLGYAVDAEKV